MKYSRNKFLKLAGLTGVASLTLPHVVARNPSLQKKELTLGLASYTLRSFKLEDVIKMTQRLELKSLALKSMHMPLDSPPDDLRKAATQVLAARLKLYGAGVIYMKTAQDVENAFTYASHAGLEVIIGVPDHALLPLVNKLVEKYNIRLAIHNHGPGDDLYRSPDDVYAKVSALDKRIGLCIDIGHVVRIGQDPVPMIEKYQDRLYDLHIKDVDKAQEDGGPVEIGRGVIDIPKVIGVLKKISYRYTVAIEYEKDGEDPLPGLAESVGYLRGVMRVV